MPVGRARLLAAFSATLWVVSRTICKWASSMATGRTVPAPRAVVVMAMVIVAMTTMMALPQPRKPLRLLLVVLPQPPKSQLLRQLTRRLRSHFEHAHEHESLHEQIKLHLRLCQVLRIFYH
ncbi:hypothetical protein B0H19DRAFT_715880 [Mycena capillaripes]|nr:hypothetical protein B0H19DRAFT_715880 [Mycena capillaripes]